MNRAQDLAWMAEVTSALHDVYAFLLRSTVIGELEDSNQRTPPPNQRTPPPPDRLAQIVDGRVAEAGTPLVRAREGSLVLELSQALDASTGVQVLLGFTLLLKKGPDVVAWPNRLRQAWFSSAAEAEKARQDLKALHRIARVEVLEDVKPEEASPMPMPMSGPSMPASRGRRRAAPEAGVTRGEAYIPGPDEDED